MSTVITEPATTGSAGSEPITALPASAAQHMLLLFMPLKKGTIPQGLKSANTAFGPPPPAEAAVQANGIDPRVSTGVHFAMFYGLPADTRPAGLPVPSFATAPGKDLLVVQSFYDADFGPYISSFTSNPGIALGLNGILSVMDETGIVEPKDPTSAAFILGHGGVAKNNTSFLKLLMRYNFADPTIPAAAAFPINTPAKPKYVLTATFPGMTVGQTLQNYTDAASLWPLPAPNIQFEPSVPPPAA